GSRAAGQLANHPAEVERVVERRDAIRHVEGRGVEREVLAVRLDAAEVPVDRTAAEPDVAVDEDVRRDELALSLEPEPRSPGLRGTDLEHAQPPGALDVAIEQELERMAVREPVLVVPAELAVDERKHGIDRVVRLVDR